MGKSQSRIYTPGLNIRYPWSQLILSGKKTVETRNYPIPEKYLGKLLCIIETGNSKPSKIVGLVRFSSTFKYNTFEQWEKDYVKHLVPANDNDFRFSLEKEKWGWNIDFIYKIDQLLDSPKKKGIIYAKKCCIPKAYVPENVYKLL